MFIKNSTYIILFLITFFTVTMSNCSDRNETFFELWQDGERGDATADNWCATHLCRNIDPNYSPYSRNCLNTSYCESDSRQEAEVCTLPGICVPIDRCVSDRGCLNDRICYGGRCLSQEEIDEVPTPTYWGYMVDPHLTSVDSRGRFFYVGESRRQHGCFRLYGNTTNDLSINATSPEDERSLEMLGYPVNMTNESIRNAIRNDELTQLFAITLLPDGTYLFQVFSATNDIDQDGFPDQEYQTRNAGNGIFYISAENYARGREHALRLDELGTSIEARHATDLPWRMPFLPWARTIDGMRDYTLQFASLHGDLYVGEKGLWTGTSTLTNRNYSFRHGNLIIGGSIYIQEMLNYIVEETSDCECEGIDDVSYVQTDQSESGDCCAPEIDITQPCTNADERPFWCDPNNVCGDKGVTHYASELFATLDIHDDSREDWPDSVNACFMPEIVPAQVIIEGISDCQCSGL